MSVVNTINVDLLPVSVTFLGSYGLKIVVQRGPGSYLFFIRRNDR